MQFATENEQPFDSLGLFTYLRTYARRHDETDPHSTVESWKECVTRVVNACNTQLKVGFTDTEKQEFFDYLYNLKCSVAGRFLWQLGTRTVDKLGLMSLQNCAFTVIDSPVKPFTWIMNFLMLGAGCGYRISQEDIEKFPVVKSAEIVRRDEKDSDFIVPDSRQGWIKLLGKILKAHFYSGTGFTYSCHLVRSKGASIKGFGGLSSGPEILCDGITKISALLNSRAGQKLTSVDALDIANIIGMIVVSGNVRRCLPKGVLVHTQEGLIPIENITVGTKVLSSNNNYNRVLNKFTQGVQKLVTIKTEIGYFKCTANHKMAVSVGHGSIIEWKEASTLTKYDHLLYAGTAIPGKKTNLPEDSNLPNVPHLNFESARFIGYFQIHGKVDVEKGQITIAINNPENVQMIYAGLRQYLYSIDISKTSESVVSFSKELSLYLDKFIGNTQTPHFIKEGFMDVRYGYLKGALDCNDVRTASETLATDIQSVGSSIGRMFFLTKFQGVYQLAFDKNLTPDFSGHYNVGIIGLEDGGEAETYDIEVEDEHQFFCNGYLTHNSAQIALGDASDAHYMKAKRWDLGTIPNWRCYSNNSVICNDIEEIIDNEDFWAGYNGNGEPYGLVNLKLSKSCGRLGDTQYPDPNVEGYNPCVAGDTWVFTADGPRKASELVGKSDLRVYVNGILYKTSDRGFFMTSPAEQLYTLYTTDGYSVRTTSNHKFLTPSGWRMLEELENGDEVYIHTHSSAAVWGSNIQTENLDGYDYYSHYIEGNGKVDFDKLEKSSYGFYIGFFICAYAMHGQMKDSKIQISYESEQLGYCMQRMLARLGLLTSISVEKHVLIIHDSMSFSQILRGVKTAYSHDGITIVDRVEESTIEPTYDCTVPGIGKFDANAFVVSNCAEQSLARWETCCLGEVYLPNISTIEELKTCVTYIYRACKHSLALPCVDSKETEDIVHNNYRMGIGITGYLQATEEQRGWLKDCYLYLREYDRAYSLIKNMPPSVKLTTCKPSGTLSILGHCTSGVHPGFAQYYIRRIRVSSESKLIDVAKTHGYHLEYVQNFDGSLDYNTQVISFPYALPEGTILAENCTAVQQLEYVKRLQTEWSDNAVSVTVYYKKEELPEIKEWLRKNYNSSVKTVSFLLHSDHGFKQAPLEKITKEQYEEMIKTTRPITNVSTICYNSSDDKFIGEGECAGGACPLK